MIFLTFFMLNLIQNLFLLSFFFFFFHTKLMIFLTFFMLNLIQNLFFFFFLFFFQYHSDIGSDVYDDMYNQFSQGDSNCNSIDQSKSPQIMQVKHLGK